MRLRHVFKFPVPALLAFTLVYGQITLAEESCPNSSTNSEFISSILSGKAVRPVRIFAIRKAFHEILENRCNRYAPLNSNSKCRAAVSGFADVMDADTLGDPVAAFSSELGRLLKDPATLRYLKTLNTLLQSPSANKKINLWDWTLLQAEGNRKRALQWIAVLFQDTSGALHADYAKSVDPSLPDETIKLLRETCSRLRDTKSVDYYPQSVGIGVNSQYHFYVFAYAAEKLKRVQGVDPKYAALIPALFNTSYETLKQRMAQNLKKQTAADNQGSPLELGIMEQLEIIKSDPLPQSQDDPGDDYFEDSYLGYFGAFWGAGLSPGIAPFGEFKKQYSTDPNGFISGLFSQGNSSKSH